MDEGKAGCTRTAIEGSVGSHRRIHSFPTRFRGRVDKVEGQSRPIGSESQQQSSSERICGSRRSCEDQAGGLVATTVQFPTTPKISTSGSARRKRRGRFGVSHTFDKFDLAGCITHECEGVATFSVVKHGGFVSARQASSPCFSHCQELATTVGGSKDDESRYGLRGVRVGEASNPGPPRRHGSLGTRVCPVTRRVLTYGHGGARVGDAQTLRCLSRNEFCCLVFFCNC